MNDQNDKVKPQEPPILQNLQNSDIDLTNKTNKANIGESKKGFSTQEKINQRNKKVSRVPLKDQNLFMRPQEDGEYYYRYVNDIDNRIASLELAGYEKVANTKVNREGSNIRSGIPSQMGEYISHPVGGGITAYLMRQRREDYETDQKAKMRDLATKMKTIDRQPFHEDGLSDSLIYAKDAHRKE